MAAKLSIVGGRKPAAFSAQAAVVLRVVEVARTQAPTEADLAAFKAALSALAKAPVGLPVEALTYARSQLDRSLPKLLDRIIADLPAPGERERVAEPGALAARLDVFRSLLSAPLLPGARRRDLERRLIDRIAHAAVHYHRWLTDSLQKADPVDLRAVSFDQIRLDIIIWLLEDLGGTTALDNVRALARMTARAALRRAGQVIDAYIGTRGPSQRFDVAVVVSQVEELGTLIRRVLDSVHVDDYGIDDQGTLSRTLVEDFIHGCGLLVLATFRDLEDRQAAGTLTTSGLRGALKQITALRTFIHGIDVPGGTRIRLAVERTITRRARMTVTALSARQADNPAATHQMLRELAEFLALAHQPDDKG